MVSRRKLRGMDVYFNDPRTPGVGEDLRSLSEPLAPSAAPAVAAADRTARADSSANGSARVEPVVVAAGPTDAGAASSAPGVADAGAEFADVLVRLDLGRLRFLPEQQPRDMLPAEAWSRLVAAGANTPAGSLEALRAAAAPKEGEPRPASRRVLEHVQELAESIRSDGVLVPLIVLRLGDELVVLDGHCRAMAGVVAGIGEVPARVQTRAAIGDEADLTDAAHRFVLNWTQRRLSPLEAARQVQRIVDVATRVVGAKRESVDNQMAAGPADESVDAESAEIARLAASVDLAAGELSPGQTRSQETEAAIRRLVLARTGLSLSQYYVLRQINNLAPDAWSPADGLSEGHLRAIVTAPADLHLILVRLVQLAQASVKETKAYARAAREQGEEYLTARIADLMRRREAPARQRTAVSWEPLLRAVPDDLTPRLSALYAELGALDDERRAVRLRAVARQLPLLEELLHAYREVLDRYGVGSDGAPTVADEALAEEA